MAITVSPNKAYIAANIVSQKYNPFKAQELRLDRGDKSLHSKIMTYRSALLKKMNLLPQALRLMTSNWTELEKAEIGKKPPLVVVSSNRSEWIKQGLAAADAELKKLNIPNFTNVSDFRALRGTDGQKGSPPIYCPKRLGDNPGRSVYIVVHLSEYDKYKKALSGSGITVIGWDFEKPKNAQSFVGFGASRFAAVEFCKTLRQSVSNLGKVWDYAWLLDDNVVSLENFAGLEKVEAVLSDKVCAGFRGADQLFTCSEMKEWYAPDWVTPANLPVSSNKGILQQVGLWNIKYLTEQFLNFPPVYITSAEDISLNRYLNLKGIQYLFYDKITVVKELASLDGDAGEVNASRQYYAALFAKAESGKPRGKKPWPEPPPPINVKCGVKVTSVMDFVTTQLLVNVPGMLPVYPAERQYTAACQGVEQITKTAIGIGLDFIEDGALTATFQMNGKNGQVVELYNVK